MPTISQMIRSGRATDGHTSASLLRMGVEGRGMTVGSDDALAAADRIDTLEDVLENICIAIGMGWDLDGVMEAAKDALPLSDPGPCAVSDPSAETEGSEVDCAAAASTSVDDEQTAYFEKCLQNALTSGNYSTAVIAVLDLGRPAPVVAGTVLDGQGNTLVIQFHACGSYDVITPDANRVPFTTKTTNQIAALCLQAEDKWDELACLNTTGGWKDWSHLVTPVDKSANW